MKLVKNYTKNYTEAGCDEAGRGCLAGPVVAAAVILSDKFRQKNVNDSKKLTFKQRFEMDEHIRRSALAFAIKELSNEYIDRQNILASSIHGMHLALDQLAVSPEFILVDGNYFLPYKDIPHQCFVKGDARFLAIAAASILAKNHRDQIMTQLHEEFPMYGWNKNKGYATKDHRDALNKYGPCKYHRKSFRLDYSEKPITERTGDLFS